MDDFVFGGTKLDEKALIDGFPLNGHSISTIHQVQGNHDIRSNTEFYQGNRKGVISNLGHRTWDGYTEGSMQGCPTGLDSHPKQDLLGIFIFPRIYADHTQRTMM